jgi:hypothetical protein
MPSRCRSKHHLALELNHGGEHAGQSACRGHFGQPLLRPVRLVPAPAVSSTASLGSVLRTMSSHDRNRNLILRGKSCARFQYLTVRRPDLRGSANTMRRFSARIESSQRQNPARSQLRAGWGYQPGKPIVAAHPGMECRSLRSISGPSRSSAARSTARAGLRRANRKAAA